MIRFNTFYHPFSQCRRNFPYMSSSVNLFFPLSSVSSLTKSEAVFFPHLNDLSFPPLTVFRSIFFKSLFHVFNFYFLLRYNRKYINLKCTAQLNFEKHMSMEPPSRSKCKILFNTTEASCLFLYLPSHCHSPSYAKGKQCSDFYYNRLSSACFLNFIKQNHTTYSPLCLEIEKINK